MYGLIHCFSSNTDRVFLYGLNMHIPNNNIHCKNYTRISCIVRKLIALCHTTTRSTFRQLYLEDTTLYWKKCLTIEYRTRLKYTCKAMFFCYFCSIALMILSFEIVQNVFYDLLNIALNSVGDLKGIACQSVTSYYYIRCCIVAISLEHPKLSLLN